MFENVEGFLTGNRGQGVIDLLDPLIEAGYQIHLRKVNAANFGIPQHRKRVLAIGGFGWDPGFPEPTNWAFGAPGAENAGRDQPPGPTVEAALSGLPKPSDVAPGEPVDHFVPKVSTQDQERINDLKQGQRMRDLPEHLWHETYRRRANRRVQDGTPTEKRGGAPAGIRRLRGAEPSKAITSGARSELIHPFENRPLTLRECARLQTFPDDFVFKGNMGERMLQIANAVPPTLAQAVAERIKTSLLKHRLSSMREPGALLSFVPTLANGMSPALRSTCETVRQRYLSGEVQQELPLDEIR